MEMQKSNSIIMVLNIMMDSFSKDSMVVMVS